jgi:DNA-binding CsgD family transcriptional regulator
MLDPRAASQLMARLRDQSAAHRDPLARLSGQERRILELIGDGLTNRQIGERMFLAEKTVKNYVSALFAKLGMERRTQAVAYAVRAFGDQHDQRDPGYGEGHSDLGRPAAEAADLPVPAVDSDTVTARESMSTDAATVRADATMAEAARLIDRQQVTCLLVTDENRKLLGMVSSRTCCGFSFGRTNRSGRRSSARCRRVTSAPIRPWSRSTRPTAWCG